jgi:hypothetical protein
MSPCPSGTIQEQIDCLEQSIYDLEYSASGVLAYSGAFTIDGYEEVWWKTMRDFNERLDELDEGIVKASGYLRILDNGLAFHRH